jgi:hypothetical protein
MFKSISPKTVAIHSFPSEEKTGVLEKSETTMAEEMKKQNRGKVVLVGKDVEWPEVGMTVTYLRHAATDLPKDDDDKVYQIVNQAHVLAEFDTKLK